MQYSMGPLLYKYKKLIRYTTIINNFCIEIKKEYTCVEDKNGVRHRMGDEIDKIQMRISQDDNIIEGLESTAINNLYQKLNTTFHSFEKRKDEEKRSNLLNGLLKALN